MLAYLYAPATDPKKSPRQLASTAAHGLRLMHRPARPIAHEQNPLRKTSVASAISNARWRTIHVEGRVLNWNAHAGTMRARDCVASHERQRSGTSLAFKPKYKIGVLSTSKAGRGEGAELPRRDARNA